MASEKYSAQIKYAKSNVKKVNCTFKAEFVDEFKEACAKLGLTQAEVIRKAMQQVIDQANNHNHA